MKKRKEGMDEEGDLDYEGEAMVSIMLLIRLTLTQKLLRSHLLEKTRHMLIRESLAWVKKMTQRQW